MKIEIIRYILLGFQLLMFSVQVYCLIVSIRCSRKTIKHYKETFAKYEDLTSEEN